MSDNKHDITLMYAAVDWAAAIAITVGIYMVEEKAAAPGRFSDSIKFSVGMIAGFLFSGFVIKPLIQGVGKKM